MKVAIIEDDATIAKLFSIVLLKAGHHVWQVDQRNLEAIGDAEVVVLDLMMPDVTGEEVLDVLAADFPHVRKIVITAVYQVPARVKALADVVLSKPIHNEELLAAL